MNRTIATMSLIVCVCGVITGCGKKGNSLQPITPSPSDPSTSTASTAPESSEQSGFNPRLTESDMRQLMLNNGKQIGTAIAMYVADYDGAYPPTDTAAKALEPYMKNKDIMLHPYSKQNIFTYHYVGAKEGDVQYPSDTVIGTLDAGFSWVVEIYADGHVRSASK